MQLVTWTMPPFLDKVMAVEAYTSAIAVRNMQVPSVAVRAPCFEA